VARVGDGLEPGVAVEIGGGLFGLGGLDGDQLVAQLAEDGAVFEQLAGVARANTNLLHRVH